MKKLLTAMSLLMIVLITIIACTDTKAKATEEKNSTSTTETQIERGAYLVEVGGCHDCHSTKIMGPRGPEPDPEKFLGGHFGGAANQVVDPSLLNNFVLFNHSATMTIGPWGASYAANLSSDESGIGNWSEEQFINALRKGKLKGLEGGRPLLPPMPWQNLAKMTDDDLKSVFAYLKSTRPVDNVVPPPTSLEQLLKK